MQELASEKDHLCQITSAYNWVAVDWGTSSLRAWLIDENGAVQTSAKSAQGAGTLQPAEFEGVLLNLIGDWLHNNAKPTQAFICGMAGSRQGWKEAPYVPLPTKLTELHQHLASPETDNPRLQPFIVPGLCQKSQHHPDVMRGEETQLLGILEELSNKSGVVCLPGTHSKWVEVKEGIITRSSTFLSGELFALLSKHSILRHSLDAKADLDKDVFLKTLDQLRNQEVTLLGDLFALRAGQLLNDATRQAGASRLSALIIGSELLQMRTRQGDNAQLHVHVVGDNQLAQNYALAMQHLGIEPILHDADTAALKGLSAIKKGAQNDNN